MRGFARHLFFGQRTGRVEIRAIVNADSETLDQLAA
jgi:hypothetical protein